MNKLGVNFSRNYYQEEANSIRGLKEIGFDAFFTGWEGDNPALIEENAENARKVGMWYECIHAPFAHINNIWKAGEDGDTTLGELTRTVDYCRQFGIPKVVVHLSSGDAAPCVNDIGHERLDRLVDHAVKNDITVCFENQRKLANLAFAFELYAGVEKVKFCWDVGHEHCFAYGKEFMPLFGDKLVYTHIHDNFSVHNEDLHMLPFDGGIDFTHVAELLKKAGYEETLTLEVIPPKSGRYEGWTAEKFYREAFARVTRLRELVEKA